MTAIPTRIIQTAKSHDLSPVARAVATNLKLLHPGWEYLFFDDEDVRRFIIDDFPDYRGLFESFPYNIQRIDLFRYLAIYKFGGFYFDLDVLLWKSLTGLLDRECVFPFEELTSNAFLRKTHSMDWEIGNYAFGSAPRHPFLKAVIENCARAQHDKGFLRPMMAGVPSLFRADFEVLNSTGPSLLSRTLAENSHLASSVTVPFPEDVCDVKSWHHFGTYGFHIMEGSWRSRGGFLHRRLAWWWEGRTKRRLMPQSLKLGPKRSAGVTSMKTLPSTSA